MMWHNRYGPADPQPPALQYDPQGSAIPQQPGGPLFGQPQHPGAPYAGHQVAGIPPWAQSPQQPHPRPMQRQSTMQQPLYQQPLQEPQYVVHSWPQSAGSQPQQQPLQELQQQVDFQQSLLPETALQQQQQQQQAQLKPHSKSARKRAAKQAAKQAARTKALQHAATVAGTKRSQWDKPAEALEQQQLKRLRGADPELVQHQDVYVSLLDLCLRKARHGRSYGRSTSSSPTQGLVTVPQLHASVNTEAKAQGVPDIALSQLQCILERYLLALEVPTAKQQKANQQAVADQASLGVQSAARILHASVVAGDTTDSDDDKQQPHISRPSSSVAAGKVKASLANATVTSAGARATAEDQQQPVQRTDQTQQQQQGPEHQPHQLTLSLNQRRHVRFADDGPVTFGPGALVKQPKPAAAASAAPAQPHHQQQGPAAATATAAAGLETGQEQERREQQQQQLPSIRRRHIKFDDDGTVTHSAGLPGTLSDGAAAAAGAVPTEPQQSGQQQQPRHIKFAASSEDGSRRRSSSDADSGGDSPTAPDVISGSSSSPPTQHSPLPTPAASGQTLPPPPPPPLMQTAFVPGSQGGNTQSTNLSSPAVLGCSLTLPVIWDEMASDAAVSGYVNSRRICTLMDLRQHLLVLHGLTTDEAPPSGGLLMSASAWADCPTVKKFFAVAPQLQVIPPVTAHHVVQAATLALLCKWQQHSQQQGPLISHDYHTVPTHLQQDELNRELFYGNAAIAASQGWQSCVRLPDLAALAQITAQQLRLALAAAEAAVMQQMQDDRQHLGVTAQQHWHLPQWSWQQQTAATHPPGSSVLSQAAKHQQQQPASLAGVCAALDLNSSSYQALLEATAMLAETSLRDAGQWSEWICLRTFNKNFTALLSSSLPAQHSASYANSIGAGQAVLATTASAVAVQLLQHVLYYTINNRIAELYIKAAPPASVATAAATSTQTVAAGAQPAAADPATQFVRHLQQLQTAFVALFPAGKQYSPDELQQLRADLLQQLVRHDSESQQAAGDAEPDPAAAAAKVGKVLMLALRLLTPVTTAAAASSDDGRSSTCSEEQTSSDMDTTTSSSRDADEDDKQKQRAAPRQQQHKSKRHASITHAQLTEAITELAPGFSIAALASLEQQLLDRFAVQSFNGLGLGADSLLQLLQNQPQLLTHITGQPDAQACDVGARVDLQDVLRLVRQTAACCADMPEEQAAAAVSRCLCGTYGVQDVKQLGHGGVATLMQLIISAADAALSNGSSSTCVSDVYALAAPELAQTPKAADGVEPAAVSVKHHSAAGAQKEAAIRCLLAAPLMTDLHSWSQWQQAFEAILGDLGQFITTEGPAAGLMALALPRAALSVININTPSGQCSRVLLKLNAVASREQLQQATAQGDAVGVVGTALSLVCLSGGLGLAPLSLLAQAVQAGLQTLAVAGGQQRSGLQMSVEVGPLDAPTSAGASNAAALILQCLTLLPDPLTATLSQLLLLQPLYSLLGSAAAAQSLLLEVADATATEAAAAWRMLGSNRVAVAYSADLAVLHRLGWELGIMTWQHDWQQRCSSPGQQVEDAAKRGARQQLIDPVTDQNALMQPSQGTLTLESHTTALQQLLLKLRQPQLQPSAAGPAAPAATQGESPSSAGPVAAAAAPQQQLIEQIRQHDFGVGVDLSGPAGELVARQRARLGRALTRLSKELYSSNTHFVLELVQNADDNSYAPGTVPTLEFVLMPGAVAAMNNETGFTEKDVRALCDVGASTKLSRQGGGGYIGYKGIGFKSVFKVSNEPQLHSAGYHIKFDLQQDPAQGYILPTWMTEHESEPAGSAAASSRLGLPFDTSTTIYLPLKQQTPLAQQHQLHPSSLRQRFHDIKPALLLFLDKLSCICVTDVCQPSHSTVMCKQQLGNHVVELRYGDRAQHAEHWLVVRSTVTLPASWHARHQTSLADTYNPAAHSSSTTTTQLALAFSLDNPQQPQQQPVYAFLPLRNYGLNFILQADWQVPSSREAVDADSLWNQALRDEVPALLLAAMHAFNDLATVMNTHASPAPGEGAASDGGQLSLPLSLPQQQQGYNTLPRLSLQAWLDCWLRCLPLQGQAQGFFAGLPHSIANHLRSHPCIPTESGALARPRDVLVCNNSTVRELISPEQLQLLLGKQFVHSEVIVLHTNAELRALLGVGEFSPLQVVQLIEQMASTGGMQQQGVEWVQRVLLCLFGMMEAESGSAAAGGGSWSDLTGHLGRAKVLQRLRKLQIVPLQDGSFVPVESVAAKAPDGGTTAEAVHKTNPSTVSSKPVFFPLQGIKDTSAAAPGPTSPQRKAFSSPSPSKRPAGAASPGTAVQGPSAGLLTAEQPTLMELLDAAGIDPEWLTGLQFLSSELFNGLRSDEMELMHSGLMALGVREAQPADVMQLSGLPSMASAAAAEWNPQRLVAWLAFPLLAGLLQPMLPVPTAVGIAQTPWTSFKAAVTPAPAVTATNAPMTARYAVSTGVYPGLRLQQQQQDRLMAALRDCAVVVTTQGPVRLAGTKADSAIVHTNSGAFGAERQYSSSVYLPPCWTSHQTDWQQHFPQLKWKVISPLYQQLHPEVEQQWAALFKQLGVQDLPPLLPRIVSASNLQQQQVQLQQRQQELLAKLQRTAERGSLAQRSASDTAGGGAVPHPLDSASDDDMEISTDDGAVDMDLSTGDEHDQSPQVPQQRLQQDPQHHNVGPMAFQQVTLAEAAAGACRALAAATEAVAALEAACIDPAAAADAALANPDSHAAVGFDSAPGGTASNRSGAQHNDSQCDGKGPFLQDWVCRDLQALMANMAAAVVGVTSTRSHDAGLTEYRQGMSRLLRLLDQHWGVYAHHMYAHAAAAAAAATLPQAEAAGAGGGPTRQLAATGLGQAGPHAPEEAVQRATPVPLAWRDEEPTADVAAAAAADCQPSHQGGESGGGSCLTSFGQLLQCSLWPCWYLGGPNTGSSDTGLQQQQLHLLPGHLMLLPSSGITSLLGAFQLPYLDVSVHHTQLLDVLQISSVFSVELVLKVLMCQATLRHFDSALDVTRLRAGGDSQQQHTDSQHLQQGLSFVSSCQLMGKAYGFLEGQLTAARQQATAATTTDADSILHYRRLQQLVSSAFQQHALVWLPHAACQSVAQPAAAGTVDCGTPSTTLLQATVCPGRFYRLQELCLRDPSGVLDGLACNTRLQHTHASGPARCTIPRPVLQHYHSLQQLFSEHLAAPAAPVVAAEYGNTQLVAGSTVCIVNEPSTEQYLAAIDLLAVDADSCLLAIGPSVKLARHLGIWKQVLRVLKVLASRFAEHRLSQSELGLLQRLLEIHRLLWCYNTMQCVCLQQEPYLADDARLAAIMSKIPGVHLLQLPPPQHAANQSDKGSSAQHQLVQLFSSLGVLPLSQSVTIDIQYEEMSDWHEMAQRIAEALLMAQRWCWYNKTRQEYHAIADVLLPKLDFLTVVAVRDLAISYSIIVEGGETAVSRPVPAAVLQHDMQLLVAPDQPGLYLEMAQQLARLVLGDSQDVHALTDLLLPVLHELSNNSSSNNSSNNAEMLMQSRGIPQLPAEVVATSGLDTAADVGQNQQQEAGPSSGQMSAVGSDQQVRLWQLYVPSPLALYSDDEADDDAAADAEWDDAAPADYPAAEDAAMSSDEVGNDVEDEYDSDYDDDEQELEEVEESQAVDGGLPQVVACAAPGASEEIAAGQPQPIAQAAVAAAMAQVVLPTAGPRHATPAQQLLEPVVTPVRQMPSAGTGKAAVVLAVYQGALAAVAAYLEYAAAAAAASRAGAASTSGLIAVERSAPAAAVNGSEEDKQPSAAAAAECSISAETSRPEEAAGVQQQIANISVTAADPAAGLHPDMLSCGRKHLAEAAEAAFFKLLDGRTVTQEESHRVLPAAGATAAALSRAAGLHYGCREHVAFLNKLLTSFIPGRLGTNKQWKSRNVQGPEKEALATLGKVKLIDVTPMQPLVLWETAQGILTEQNKATGRWGEQLVAIYLTVKLARVAEVVWVNDKQETGLPYDIKVTYHDGRIEYVEVKATVQSQLHQFYISFRELETAAKYGKAFTVVRVFGCPVYSLRPQQVQDDVALVPGDLRVAQQEQGLPAKLKRPRKGQNQPKVPPARLQHTRLLFLQDPVQLLRRQLVRLLMQV